MMLQFSGTIALFSVFTNCQNIGQDAATCSLQPVANRNCGPNNNPSASWNVNSQYRPRSFRTNWAIWRIRSKKPRNNLERGQHACLFNENLKPKLKAPKIWHVC